jgi:hypothetical protein
MDSGLLEMKIQNVSDKASEARHRAILLEQLVSELSKRVYELEKKVAECSQ